MLTFQGRSLKIAPQYAPHRRGVAAVDTPPETEKSHGINGGHYRTAHVQVIPTGGANPTVEVYWWSETAGEFVQEHTPLQFAGVGADTGFEFTIECRGRIFVVLVTTLAAGSVDIDVAGYDLDHTL